MSGAGGGLQGRERLQPSLLDRLLDHAPTRLKESAESRTMSLAQFRASVLRDLAALLNTSNLETIEDLENAPLVRRSTLNYGIPGFAGLLESSGRASAIERELAEAIRAYEPRIRPETVRVRALAGGEAGAVAALEFEIEGELWAQPVPQQMVLQTRIEIETRLATVMVAKEPR